MNEDILEKINQDFEENERTLVLDELSSIQLIHVMAESEYNLYNTRMAILYLAKGDLEEVIHLTERAKIDFRDVIMLAIEENKD